jgi:hypothetical protein
MKIPESEHSIVALIDKHHEEKNDPPRPHLGASLLGHPCDRWLWLSFRWAVQEQFPGRILRLFRRGQMEEATIVSDLRAIGLDVRGTTGGKQTRVDFGAHVSGSLDAIIERGVPEAPKARHIAEFKTHSKKSFDEMVKDGVEKSKPQHWVQMQVYMHGTEIDRALYVAVCKDDDRIYTERVKYDKAAAEKAIERGQRITLADRMPEPMPGASASWYQCKFCPAYEFCHETKLAKHVNCRTCAHSTAQQDSTWRCERHEADGIPVEFQREGCDSHVLHPDLVPWQLDADASSQWDAVWLIDGKQVRNGEPDANVYASKEIVANPNACASGDEFIAEMRREFGGRIVK